MSISNLPAQQEALQRLVVFYEMLANPQSFAELLADVKTTLAGMQEVVGAYDTVIKAQAYFKEAQSVLAQAQTDATAIRAAAQTETAAVKAAQVQRAQELDALDESARKILSEARQLESTAKAQIEQNIVQAAKLSEQQEQIKIREDALVAGEAALKDKIAAMAKLAGA